MRKYLLLTGAALIGFSGAAYAAIDCAVPPTCEELGYTMTTADCKDLDILKCPFDSNKVFCSGSTAVECNVGSILYSTLECYAGRPVGVEAIGVVFDTTNRLFVSKYGGSNSWGNTGDISGLTNCSTSNAETCDTNGKSNTRIIAQKTSGAAKYCYQRAEDGLSSNSFFLPSIKQMKILHENISLVNEALKKLNEDTIKTSQTYYWSSNEFSRDYALAYKFWSDGVLKQVHKTTANPIICIANY